MWLKTYIPAGIVLAAALTSVVAATDDNGHALSGRRPAAVLRESGVLRNSDSRRRAADELTRDDRVRRALAAQEAQKRGLPLGGELPGGGVWAFECFEGDRPLYRTTLNAAAAITTAADLIRAEPYNASGSGGVVGVWDASAARVTHQEFGGRVTAMDGAAATSDHSTHVVGTVCAAGVVESAKGMAPLARVDSYDWWNDIAEMTLRGAAYPGEPDKIYVSNHILGHEHGQRQRDRRGAASGSLLRHSVHQPGHARQHAQGSAHPYGGRHGQRRPRLRARLGADVRLKRAGAPDVPAQQVVALGDKLEASLGEEALSSGWWNLCVTNPDGQQAVLYNAFLSGSPSPRPSRATVVMVR